MALTGYLVYGFVYYLALFYIKGCGECAEGAYISFFLGAQCVALVVVFCTYWRARVSRAERFLGVGALATATLVAFYLAVGA